MATFSITPFMETLRASMLKNDLAETSADLYLKLLFNLNGKAPFNNLSFLKKTDALDTHINQYSDNTKRNYYSAILNALRDVKDKASYKKTHKHWADVMAEKTKEHRENKDDQKKSERQKENWVDWSDVEKKATDMRNSMLESVKGKKVLTPQDFDKILNYLILSLYVYIPPRRNQDYLDMYVVKKYSDEMPKDKNYLDLAGKQFVFNIFKTAKKVGQQKVPIPDTADAPLMDTIITYLKFHPGLKGNKSKSVVAKFLVSSDGTPITAVNAITRVLNRIFGKKVGSSMLRHIYLSHKYGDKLEEMKEDAEKMAHSMAQQKEYIKTDDLPYDEMEKDE
jgi:integrase